MGSPIQVVLQFEEAINSRNPDSICSLMAADGEFIDSLGNLIQGTAKLRAVEKDFAPASCGTHLALDSSRLGHGSTRCANIST